MSVKQMVLAARLANKGSKDREFLEKLGINIYYDEYTDDEGEGNDEKEHNYRNAETVRCSQVQGHYIF